MRIAAPAVIVTACFAWSITVDIMHISIDLVRKTAQLVGFAEECALN
jgi:hypothetical protein